MSGKPSRIDTSRVKVFAGVSPATSSLGWADIADIELGPVLQEGRAVSRGRHDMLKVAQGHVSEMVKLAMSRPGKSQVKSIGLNIMDYRVVDEMKVSVPDDTSLAVMQPNGRTRVGLRGHLLKCPSDLTAVRSFLQGVKDSVADGSNRHVDWALELVEKSMRLKNPSMVLDLRQLPQAFVLPADTGRVEPYLQSFVVPSINTLVGPWARHVKGFRAKLVEEATLGNYTRHDPAKLRERVSRYCRERIPEFKGETARVVGLGISLLEEVKKRNCVKVQARRIEDLGVEDLDGLMRNGSAGEYKYFGYRKRKEPELMGMLHNTIVNFLPAARAFMRTGKYPIGRLYPEVLTILFGKKETVSDKMVNGVREEKVQRCIFDGPPNPYAIGAFLYGDLIDSFKKGDPTFGPGMGKARKKDRKVQEFLYRSFPSGVESKFDMIMADIKHWDTALVEAMIYGILDMYERLVDKSNLGPDEKIARQWLVELNAHYLIDKHVAHPSGFVFLMKGCMGSGSFFTSPVNTDANSAYFFSHCFYSSGVASLSPHFVDVAGMSVRSNGDNQLASSELLELMGGTYKLEKHKEFLARVGMEMKASETIVSRELHHVAYCSTKYVRLMGNNGLNGPFVPVRPYNALMPKLFANEVPDQLSAKLYVRALMLDTLGVDPVLFSYLSELDQSLGEIDVDKSKVGKRKYGKMLRDIVVKLFGEDDEDGMREIIEKSLNSGFDRRTCLSLLTVAPMDLETQIQAKYKMSGEFGLGLSIGEYNLGFARTDEVFRKLEKFNIESYVNFLVDTGQKDVLLDLDDISKM
ncbi:RNA-dependent RNA polymerase [Hadaka virus 1]|uniref:RNA-dependent RNA polymerase n=1 Tax=Hadaka virus 1 TaxID=2703488 RepID=A0A6J4BJE4_9VIRU|nr:RNA-dependent RNA polymerase [Hadaka virus 1]BBU94038.1 RNA-dependent RNA polymerase [Hadaka virus 1]